MVAMSSLWVRVEKKIPCLVYILLLTIVIYLHDSCSPVLGKVSKMSIPVYLTIFRKLFIFLVLLVYQVTSQE